jgi:hypothetical protein
MVCIVICIVHSFVINIVAVCNNIGDNTEYDIVILSYCINSYNKVRIVQYCVQYCKGLVCRCSKPPAARVFDSMILNENSRKSSSMSENGEALVNTERSGFGLQPETA